MKKNKIWLSFLFVLVLLASTTITAFAQSETETLEEPALADEPTSFWENPIVRLLSEFFKSLFEEPAADEVPGEELPGEEPPPDGGGLPDDPPIEPEEPGTEPEPDPAPLPQEVVSAMHTEDNVGFGEMVKLFAMVQEAQSACADDEKFCDVTLESILQEYKDGDGFGALFEKYGKPGMTGVGHVRKAAEEEVGDAEGEEFEHQFNARSKEKSNNGKAKGKDK